jgi:hypothetical protein
MARKRDPNQLELRLHLDNFFWLAFGRDWRRQEGHFLSFGLVPMSRLAAEGEESPRLWSVELTTQSIIQRQPGQWFWPWRGTLRKGWRLRFQSDWRKVGGALRGWY